MVYSARYRRKRLLVRLLADWRCPSVQTAVTDGVVADLAANEGSQTIVDAQYTCYDADGQFSAESNGASHPPPRKGQRRQVGSERSPSGTTTELENRQDRNNAGFLRASVPA